ncbi:transporter [Aerococcus urinaehominis]|uniref:Transporter n=1 Tax=Aerococcus urinaehominis TaxID=128944 RepID=A0A0X8FL35_9LACT|nr:cation diffusion facilitator family transporter [Aerococcus urinaehominis]AMB99302.1 transporter [Aerococcus urinaehominis]SDM19525.1 cation diffusion facilitator family transporter [Aerococcus urinaehominis]
MEDRRKELKQAEKGSWISLIAYLIISAGKLLAGYLLHSAALVADGYNNLSDSINSIAMIVGLRYAQKPADANHRYGHWKGETVATLAMSFMILYIGIQVTLTAIKQVLNPSNQQPSLMTATVAGLSALIMLGVYWYNQRLAKRVHSDGLAAAAKDNLADMLTSLATMLAVIASKAGWSWADPVMAVIVGLIILKTGLEIFVESVFVLTDGFPEDELMMYREEILKVRGVLAVKSIRGRSYGGRPSLDVTILVDPSLTIVQAHDISDQVEEFLDDLFAIHSADIHVEPMDV